MTSSGEGVSFAVNTEIPDLQISWVQFSSSSILNRDFSWYWCVQAIYQESNSGTGMRYFLGSLFNGYVRFIKLKYSSIRLLRCWLWQSISARWDSNSSGIERMFVCLLMRTAFLRTRSWIGQQEGVCYETTRLHAMSNTFGGTSSLMANITTCMPSMWLILYISMSMPEGELAFNHEMFVAFLFPKLDIRCPAIRNYRGSRSDVAFG